MKKLFTLAAVCLLFAQNSFAQCPVQFLQNGPLNTCQFAPLLLSVTPGADNYEWIVNGSLVMNGPDDNYVVPTSVANTFTYQVNATFGTCTSSTPPITVTVLPVPFVNNVSFVNPAYPALGSITIPDMTPFAAYTVNYSKDGIVQAPLGIVADGAGEVVMTSLGVGLYDLLTLTLNGCVSNTVGPYNLIELNLFPGDVWPGDVNWDLTANNDDILDIGLAYGQTGGARIGASLNWVAQTCTDWGTAQVNGADMKHADCNGDGIVDATDEDAVTLNYGMIHPKGVHLPQAKSAALPDLYFDLTGINFIEGTTVSIPIKLGTGTMPMNNILGIAAKIKVQNITLVNAPTVNNITSWIGSGTNTMNFYKGVNPNQTDWALVRTDHNNVSGDGTIATLVMDIPVGSSGDAILYFEGVKIIDNAGNVLTDYNVVDDTATIIPVAISNTENASDKIVIVPNPSEGQANLEVTLAKSTKLDITITDITGKKVWHHSMKASKDLQSISLPFTQLVPGAYNILLVDEKGKVSTIKWIKK